MTRSFPVIPILLILAVILLVLAPSIAAGIAQIEPVEFKGGVALATGGLGVVDVDNDHAWESHGAEAIAAFRCIESKGPSLTYREPNKGAVHLLCLGDDGRWYDVIIEYLKKGKIRLKSAFSPQNEAVKQSDAIRIWLEGKGATPWKGGPSTIEFRWHVPKPY